MSTTLHHEQSFILSRYSPANCSISIGHFDPSMSYNPKLGLSAYLRKWSLPGDTSLEIATDPVRLNTVLITKDTSKSIYRHFATQIGQLSSIKVSLFNSRQTDGGSVEIVFAIFAGKW